mmetsp:Transcript_50251/g.76487  ORF Transcript_50251/g.76487 Transcript_50251/m.76487 type:complete len:248 (-) Transcript_50251:156-899(-)
MRGVEDCVRRNLLDRTSSSDIDFVHRNHGLDIIMVRSKNLSETGQDGSITLQCSDLLVSSLFLVRPNVGSFRFLGYVGVDPLAKFLHSLARRSLNKNVAIAIDAKLGNKKVSFENAVNDKGHEPQSVNYQHGGVRLDVARHHGLFHSQPMRQILKTVTRGNYHAAQFDGIEFKRNNGNGHLHQRPHHGSMERSSPEGSSRGNDDSIGKNSNLQVKDKGQLDSSPNTDSSRKHVGENIQVMLVVGVKF